MKSMPSEDRDWDEVWEKELEDLVLNARTPATDLGELGNSLAGKPYE